MPDTAAVERFVAELRARYRPVRELLGVRFPVPLYDMRRYTESLEAPVVAPWGERLYSGDVVEVLELGRRGWFADVPYNTTTRLWYFDAGDPAEEDRLRRILEDMRREVHRLIRQGHRVQAVDVALFGATIYWRPRVEGGDS